MPSFVHAILAGRTAQTPGSIRAGLSDDARQSSLVPMRSKPDGRLGPFRKGATEFVAVGMAYHEKAANWIPSLAFCKLG